LIAAERSPVTQQAAGLSPVAPAILVGVGVKARRQSRRGYNRAISPTRVSSRSCGTCETALRRDHGCQAELFCDRRHRVYGSGAATGHCFASRKASRLRWTGEPAVSNCGKVVDDPSRPFLTERCTTELLRLRSPTSCGLVLELSVSCVCRFISLSSGLTHNSDDNHHPVPASGLNYIALLLP
jgi:hypothetical protein